MSFYRASFSSEDSKLLKQYGVKGMKWYQTLMAKKKANKEKQASDEAKKNKVSNPNTREGIKKLTDAELNEKIARLDLERKYKELLDKLEPPAPPKSTRAEKMVKDILEQAGKDIGSQAASYVMGQLLNKITGQEVVNPKKAQKPK